MRITIGNDVLYENYSAGLGRADEFFRNLRNIERQKIVVGRNDKIFPEPGAHPFLRDLPEAALHLFDTGHFTLEDKLDEMAPLIRDFLDRKVVPR